MDHTIATIESGIRNTWFETNSSHTVVGTSIFFVFDLLIKIANRPNGHWPSSILLTLTTMIGTQFQTLLQNLTQNT